MTKAAPARALLQSLFQAAIDEARPALVLPAHLPPPPRGRTIVVGAGKGAAAMAAALEAHWRQPLSGLVVTRYGHGAATKAIEVVEAGHPMPDAAGAAAAARILDLVRRAEREDLVLCLLSGGGSALLTLPAPPLRLADKQAVTQALLRSGATIGEINCLRKHLSAIKGGRLAAAAFPARTVSLIISDVPGDDPSTIASGPTVADPTTQAQARAILERRGIAAPPAVLRHLNDAAQETPKEGDPHLESSAIRIIACPADALAAAAKAAAKAGFAVEMLGDALEGEARLLGAAHGVLARRAKSAGKPLCILSGGETTVSMAGAGRGGRNSEYLLGLAIELDGTSGIHALAADTDGIDGSEDNAGAFLAPDTLSRAHALGLDAKALLDDNDSYGFFAALGDLLVTGPTRTNVNDFRAILVASPDMVG